MGKVYLFSPIGNTDPIKYSRDGSMLHIARIYKPDVIYLYLSKEMVDNQKLDQRYTKTLELLGEKLNHNFDIHLIERENLIDVQDYDTFYAEFKEIIVKMESQMEPGDKLLLNMASGTPAMKSALVVLATLAEYRFHAIQVSTPMKKSNQKFEDRDDYDVDVDWVCDEDNEENFENRCKEVECLNLVWMLKLNMIKKHLLAYDYHAAFEIGKEVKKDISRKAKDLLEIAAERVKLNSSRINPFLVKYGYELMDEKNDKQKIFEYALVLQLKIKREEYADFIRGITPISLDLMKIILKEKFEIKLEEYCSERNGVLSWNFNKLKYTNILEILQKAYNCNFKYGVVYSGHLNAILQNLCEDPVLKEKANSLVST